MSEEEFAYDGDHLLPWGNRRYIIPERTWSGTVIYKRKKHYFTVKDAERIIDKVNFGGVGAQDDVQKFLNFIKDVSIKLLNKVLFFLDEDQVRQIYDWIYILLGKVFSVDTSYMIPNRSKMEDMIYLLASKARLDVTIKRL